MLLANVKLKFLFKLWSEPNMNTSKPGILWLIGIDVGVLFTQPIDLFTQ